MMISGKAISFFEKTKPNIFKIQTSERANQGQDKSLKCTPWFYILLLINNVNFIAFISRRFCSFTIPDYLMGIVFPLIF